MLDGNVKQIKVQVAGSTKHQDEIVTVERILYGTSQL